MNRMHEFILEPIPYTKEAPSRALCHMLWDEYTMPNHIRNHSTQVAFVAERIAQALSHISYPLCIESIVASALLHDIAKMYCIENPSYRHNELGALWVLEKTEHRLVAQGVYYHNYLNPEHVTLPYHILPVIVMYADSRVQHADIVSLEERYADLLIRYGTTIERRKHIALVKEQALTMEKWITSLLGEHPDTLLSLS